MPYTDSEVVVSDSLTLEGVWIHDPLDAEGTVKQYRFGKASRSASVNVMGVQQIFAGRQFPVYEYGEHQDDAFAVTMNLPHGTSWYQDTLDTRGFAESKRTLYFRDNRGRSAFGVMRDYSEGDQTWGTSIGFNFSRVSRVTTEA